MKTAAVLTTEHPSLGVTLSGDLPTLIGLFAQIMPGDFGHVSDQSDLVEMVSAVANGDFRSHNDLSCGLGPESVFHPGRRLVLSTLLLEHDNGQLGSSFRAIAMSNIAASNLARTGISADPKTVCRAIAATDDSGAWLAWAVLDDAMSWQLGFNLSITAAQNRLGTFELDGIPVT